VASSRKDKSTTLSVNDGDSTIHATSSSQTNHWLSSTSTLDAGLVSNHKLVTVSVSVRSVNSYCPAGGFWHLAASMPA